MHFVEPSGRRHGALSDRRKYRANHLPPPFQCGCLPYCALHPKLCRFALPLETIGRRSRPREHATGPVRSNCMHCPLWPGKPPRRPSVRLRSLSWRLLVVLSKALGLAFCRSRPFYAVGGCVPISRSRCASSFLAGVFAEECAPTGINHLRERRRGSAEEALSQLT